MSSQDLWCPKCAKPVMRGPEPMHCTGAGKHALVHNVFGALVVAPPEPPAPAPEPLKAKPVAPAKPVASAKPVALPVADDEK